MFKLLISIISALLLTFSATHGKEGNPSPRMDKLDSTSKMAQIKLERAQKILATLVPDPQSYQLILSNNPSFGGEAVPPHIYSDKPSIILYQGALSPNRTNDEIAFMMAHEIGHLQLYHNEEMGVQMDQIFDGNPFKISGITYTTYFQKFQERQADLFGLDLYKNAGYDLNFFPNTLKLIEINPNIHFGTNMPFRKGLSSLSMKNSHFSIKERFELLVKESIT